MARSAPVIEAYGGGGFRVGGRRHEGSLLIVDDAATLWPVATSAELTPHSLVVALTAPRGQSEFLLVGMGARMAPAPRPIREACAAVGLGLEVMDTPGAIRLYNLLTAEGRRLACALIAV